MEQMINREIVKKFRAERSWSQDQLASVTGLSLRTVQRIEKSGSCSLESKKALAAAFEIDAVDLDIDSPMLKTRSAISRGQFWGCVGVGCGFVGAYLGISTSLITGQISSAGAGLYYGGVAAFSGLVCSIIGFVSYKYQ